MFAVRFELRIFIDHPGAVHLCWPESSSNNFIYIYIYIYIYVYRKSASRFSRGTVLNTLKQSRINIMRGKNDATTYPDKPVS